jgi:hypothetical protein
MDIYLDPQTVLLLIWEKQDPGSKKPIKLTNVPPVQPTLMVKKLTDQERKQKEITLATNHRGCQRILVSEDEPWGKPCTVYISLSTSKLSDPENLKQKKSATYSHGIADLIADLYTAVTGTGLHHWILTFAIMEENLVQNCISFELQDIDNVISYKMVNFKDSYSGIFLCKMELCVKDFYYQFIAKNPFNGQIYENHCQQWVINLIVQLKIKIDHVNSINNHIISWNYTRK